MIYIPKTHNERAHYFLEVAENARKKAQMYDLLISSGKVEKEKLGECKENSRSWWERHEDYTKLASKELDTKFEGESISDIVETAKEIFKIE